MELCSILDYLAGSRQLCSDPLNIFIVYICAFIVVGDFILRQTLDRERRDFYMIPVMAQDTGGRTKFTTVYVTVLDINDNAPQFYATSMS